VSFIHSVTLNVQSSVASRIVCFGTDINVVHSTLFPLIFLKRYCFTFMVFDIKFLKFLTFTSSITYLAIGKLSIYSTETLFPNTHQTSDFFYLVDNKTYKNMYSASHCINNHNIY
jgi:hypothetical protein